MDPRKLNVELFFFFRVGHGDKGGTFSFGGRLHLGWFKSISKAYTAMAGLKTCGLSPLCCCFLPGLKLVALPVVLIQLFRDYT